MFKLSSFPFRGSVLKTATQNLEEARKALLVAQEAREYAMAMEVYQTERIKRLEQVVALASPQPVIAPTTSTSTSTATQPAPRPTRAKRELTSVPAARAATA